jgi:hypothetical protein
MKYLLDTNVVSERIRPQPDEAVVAWLKEHTDDCALSVMTLGELFFGVERLAAGKRRNQLERKVRFLWEDWSDAILPLMESEAAEWGRYARLLEEEFGSNALKQFDLRDTWIAATARVSALTIVTRNARHFPFCETLNPFSS